MPYVYVLKGQRSSAVYYRINEGTMKAKDICAATFHSTPTIKKGIDRLVQRYKEGLDELLRDQEYGV